MKLLQIHHQFKDHTKVISQFEYTTHEALWEKFKKLWKTHPPPKDAVLMVCEESSEYFAKTLKGNYLL